ILRKMMAKDPQNRFQTPGEVAAALEPFSVSGPTPWETVRPALDPVGELASPADVEEGDAGALQGTIPPSPELTPLVDSAVRPVIDILPRRRRGRRRRLLGWGVFLAALLAGLAVAYFALRPDGF